MASVFSRWTHSHCIHCNGEMFVPEDLINDMEANTCVNCFRAIDEFDKVVTGYSWGPKCECGADIAGDQYHARWCPKYVDPMAPKPTKKDDYND